MTPAPPDPDEDFEGHVAALWPDRARAEGHKPTPLEMAVLRSLSHPRKGKELLPLAERVAILTARRKALAKRRARRPA